MSANETNVWFWKDMIVLLEIMYGVYIGTSSVCLRLPIPEMALMLSANSTV